VHVEGIEGEGLLSVGRSSLDVMWVTMGVDIAEEENRPGFVALSLALAGETESPWRQAGGIIEAASQPVTVLKHGLTKVVADRLERIHRMVRIDPVSPPK